MLSPHAALRVLDRYFAQHPRDGQSMEIKAAMDRLWTLVIEGK